MHTLKAILKYSANTPTYLQSNPGNEIHVYVFIMANNKAVIVIDGQ